MVSMQARGLENTLEFGDVFAGGFSREQIGNDGATCAVRFQAILRRPVRSAGVMNGKGAVCLVRMASGAHKDSQWTIPRVFEALNDRTGIPFLLSISYRRNPYVKSANTTALAAVLDGNTSWKASAVERFCKVGWPWCF